MFGDTDGSVVTYFCLGSFLKFWINFGNLESRRENIGMTAGRSVSLLVIFEVDSAQFPLSQVIQFFLLIVCVSSHFVYLQLP